MQQSRTFDRELSDLVARGIDAEPKQCWRNAALALVSKAVPDAPSARYIEGWVVFEDMPFPVEHGWVELADGRVIDPTRALLMRSPDHQSNATYYAGASYSYQELRERVLAGTSLPIAYRDHDDPTRRTGYFAAYKQLLADLSMD